MKRRRTRAPEQETTGPNRFFDRKEFQPVWLGMELAALLDCRVGTDGRLYRYANGVFLPDGDEVARAAAADLLGDDFRQNRVNEAIAWLRSEPATITGEANSDFINVRNGLLDWRTGELRPHTSKVVSTIQLPVDWNPESACPAFEQFLGEVLPPDAVALVYELIGYTILPANLLRIAILLLGSGKNGKSVLLAVIRALCGERNVVSIPLQRLAECRFAAADLYGKLANICGDLDARAIRQTDIFKQVTGGDVVRAERKYGQPFEFRPGATLLFAANEAPFSADQTMAWFDRWIVVPMDRRIQKPDPGLPARLTTQSELEGLLVRAVEGLRALRERGRFELPESVRGSIRGYRDRLDTVRGFVAEECCLDLRSFTHRTVLYGAYRDWCRRSGREPLSNTSFYDRLRQDYPAEIRERKSVGNIGFEGINLVRAVGHE